MNVCWWRRRDEPESSDLQIKETNAALHMERGNTECSVSTSFSSTSFGSFDSNYPITGQYSDVNVNYRISSVVLGSGRYGTVRECTHRSTGESFAVKSVEKAQVRALEYLQREIFMLSKINHENIVKMVDCYEDSQYVHIVTEKCAGGEVYEKVISSVNQDGCLSEDDAIIIIKQLLRAVSHLHKNNMVHRDIKPENCLFVSRNSSSIKLIDFGLSCIHSQGEPNLTARVGSCYYMSPQILNRNYDKSADIWSVGVVTYILLCGYSPFNGDQDDEVEKAIHACDYNFIHGWANKSHDALDFIRCLLKKDSRERLTADEALTHPWLNGVSTATRK